MTFVIKTRGETSRPILADYTCPEHGVFEFLADRDATGSAPDRVQCPLGDEHPCWQWSTWTPSAIDSRVRKVEAVRGGWTKPERSTFYDTRDLGEGQDLDDWRANRAAIRDEERKKHVMEMVRDS